MKDEGVKIIFGGSVFSVCCKWYDSEWCDCKIKWHRYERRV